MKFGNFKMNLQKKIFVLMLSVGVAAFIFMGIVAITGMYMVNNKINNAGQQMSENTSGFTEQFAENQIKTSLSIQAMEKAELVQQKLENAMEDVVSAMAHRPGKEAWPPILPIRWNLWQTYTLLCFSVRKTGI